MKYLNEYITKLLKTWIFYLGVIPTFYDFISAYFGWELKFSSKFLSFWAVFFILYASFEVWKREKAEKEKIFNQLEELKNSTPKYEVIIKLKKFRFDVIEKFKEEKANLLQKANKQIEILQNKKIYDNISVGEIREIFDFIPSDNMYNLENYLEELKKYVIELQNIMIDETVKQKRIYEALLEISNVGTKSDEDIYCKIGLGKQDFAYEDVDELSEEIKKIKEKIPTLPPFPKPMRILSVKNIKKINNYNSLFNEKKLASLVEVRQSPLKLPKMSNLNPPYFFVDEQSLIVKKLNLNVGMVYTKKFYLIANQINDIHFFISSKNLTQSIENVVKVIYED